MDVSNGFVVYGGIAGGMLAGYLFCKRKRMNFLRYFDLVIPSIAVEGQIGALYLILYSAGRFIIEFFRGDLLRGSVGNLSTSQFISIFMFVIGWGLFFKTRYRAKNRNKKGV